MTFITCEDRKQYPILRCVRCPRFPCKLLSKAALEEIYESSRVQKIVSLKKEAGSHMHFRFTYEDGHTVDKNVDEVDVKNVDPSLVKGLRYVDLIKTSYVPQVSVRLVEEKPKQEETAQQDQQEQPKKRRKRAA